MAMDLTLKKGALRQSLGTPKGEKIPLATEKKAAKQSKNELLRKRAQMAINMRGWGKHCKGGPVYLD